MSRNTFLMTALSLTLLSSALGCALAPRTAPVNLPQNTPALQRLNAQAQGDFIEKQVDQRRMESYLSVFTGKAPIAPNAGTIPERGGVEGRAMTRAFLTTTLKGLGYQVEEHSYRRNGANIMARLMAEVPTDEYILVGAHMDSVHNAGADDNASGSTAVLEAATVLKNLKGRKVNIIFAWFDEEELGLIGSRYLARDFRKQGLKLTSAHTIDMLGWDADQDKTVELARPGGIIWDYYQMVNETHGLNLPLDRSSTGSSDHVSFEQQGFDSVCISEEWTSGDTTPQYHRRGDTYETINTAYLATATRLVVAAVGDLALQVPAPVNARFQSHENFPQRERHFHTGYDMHSPLESLH